MRLREYLLSKRICPCDPTRGESCDYCDGTDDERRQAWTPHATAPVRVTPHVEDVVRWPWETE